VWAKQVGEVRTRESRKGGGGGKGGREIREGGDLEGRKKEGLGGRSQGTTQLGN